MTSITFRQIIFRLSIIGVALGLLANTYDVLFGSILETLHILFEVLEMVLDKVVESLFDTGVHETQTIVFYLLIAIGLGICYGLSHIFIKLYHVLTDTYISCKEHTQLYWHDISLVQKFSWISALLILFILTLMYFGLM